MVPITAHQKAQCLDVLDRLQSSRISSMFAQPIDPDRDGVPTYLQTIHRPMDLGTVRSKLGSDQYSSVSQWKEDVEQIWENCFRFNGRAVLISILAKQLQQTFRDLTENLTDSPISDWVIGLDRARLELDRILKLGPKPATLSKSASNTMATRQQSDPAPRKISTRSDSSPEKDLPPPKPVTPKKFTEDEISELAEAVNQIEDPAHIQRIVDIITKHEPHLSVAGEELEIDVSQLKVPTLIALKAFVSKL
jgi:hypothetical protein